MRAPLEIIGFAGLAVGLHLAAWSVMSGDGASSAGSGGTAPATLAAASGTASALVEAWTNPPELLTHVAQPAPAGADLPATAPDTPDTLPGRAALSERPAQAPRDESPAPPDTPTKPPAPVAQPIMPELETAHLETALALALPGATATQSAPIPPKTPPALPDAPGTVPQAMPRIDQETPPPAHTGPVASLRPVARPVARPAAKPSSPANSTAPTAAQTAAGTKQGQTAGHKNETTAATLNASQQRSLVAQWGGSIRAQVERRKRYPNGASASATAVVRLSVAPQGRLLGVGLARSSGDARLDQAALDAVRRARIPAAPKGLANASYSFDLPLAFRK